MARYSTADFSPDQLAVLAVAESFLAGIAARSKPEMHAHILPRGGAALLRDGQPLLCTLAESVERLPSAADLPQAIAEVISAQPTVLVDRDIAVAWTPFEFLIDGAVHHVGTNIMSFLKQEGKWVISGVADNTHKPE
jgi:hypothetical protein